MGTNTEELCSRVKCEEDLTGLDLPSDSGRVIVRGLRQSIPERQPAFKFGNLRIAVGAGGQILSRRSWKDICFEDCDFQEILTRKSLISNCLFRNCDCRDSGIWETEIRDSEFVDCDFRRAAFGGQSLRSPNRFKRVVFEDCDFREIARGCERYENCSFIHCRMDSVDFFNAILTDCKFEGNLVGVRFRSRTQEFKSGPRNLLTGCDFRGARLHECQFINIDLDPKQFPSDPDALVIPRGPRDFREWKSLYKADDEEGVRMALELLASYAGTPTIKSREYLVNTFGESRVNDLLRIVRNPNDEGSRMEKFNRKAGTILWFVNQSIQDQYSPNREIRNVDETIDS